MNTRRHMLDEFRILKDHSGEMFPWVDKNPWLVIPGAMIALAISHDPDLDLPELVNAWVKVVINLGAAVVALIAAWKSILWMMNHRKNSAFTRATAALAAEKEAARKEHHRHRGGHGGHGAE